MIVFRARDTERHVGSVLNDLRRLLNFDVLTGSATSPSAECWYLNGTTDYQLTRDTENPAAPGLPVYTLLLVEQDEAYIGALCVILERRYPYTVLEHSSFAGVSLASSRL